MKLNSIALGCGIVPPVLWMRALIFTVLAPGVVGFLAPTLLHSGAPVRGGLWNLGWVPACLGTVTYVSCLLSFAAARGTPAPFFMGRLRALIGEEPAGLVCGQFYRYTRNPMYVGVLMAIFGQAILFSSASIALYGLIVWLAMHVFVVFVEESHLRAKQGRSYEEYCRRVPRWIGIPRRNVPREDAPSRQS